MPDTLPKFLLYNRMKFGNRKIAMQRKRFGVWHAYTWEDYYNKVKYLCLGLVSYGMERGDKVALLGDNAPEIYWAALAAQSARGLAVGLYTDSLANEVLYVLRHSEAKFVVAQDQEQVDKILQIKSELPYLKKLFYMDPRGMQSYDDPILMSLDNIMILGEQIDKDNPRLFEDLVQGGSGDDLVGIFYTSGTTGLPKGALHTHNSLLAGVKTLCEAEKWQSNFVYISILSPAHVGEYYLGIAGQLVCGMRVDFSQKPETVEENIREIGPQIMLYAPRQIEAMASMIQVKLDRGNTLKRFVYRLFLPVGYKVTDTCFSAMQPGVIWRALHFLAFLFVFRPLKDKFGLLKLKFAYTGGTVLGPDTSRLFRAIGVNIKQLYGTSEAGICSVHANDDVNPATTGRLIPGYAVRISDEGEFLLNGIGMFKGYYEGNQIGRQGIVDGWYSTGDAGYMNDHGHLIIMDRVSELMELADTSRFPPQYIEVNLRFSPYIKDAVAIGGKNREYVTSIINIDFDNVGKWAEDHRIAYTTFTDLSQKPQVVELIQKDVERVNRLIPPSARIRKYVLLHKELDPDESELTRTRKLRRMLIEDKYNFFIQAMYEGKEEVVAEAEVTYRDGRKGKVITPVKIKTLDRSTN